MKILILRHGRTELNEKGLFNGQYDEPLSDNGREDAANGREKLARYLAETGAKLAEIYCSPLSRTWETCEIATAGLEASVTLEPRLMERTMGTLDGRDLGMSGFDPGQLFNLDYNPELPGGFESWTNVFARVSTLMDEVLTKYGDTDATVLFVTHAGTARGVYYYFNPLPEDRNILHPKMANCQLDEYQISKNATGAYDADYRVLA